MTPLVLLIDPLHHRSVTTVTKSLCFFQGSGFPLPQRPGGILSESATSPGRSATGREQERKKFFWMPTWPFVPGHNGWMKISNAK